MLKKTPLGAEDHCSKWKYDGLGYEISLHLGFLTWNMLGVECGGGGGGVRTSRRYMKVWGKSHWVRHWKMDRMGSQVRMMDLVWWCVCMGRITKGVVREDMGLG